MGTAISKRKRRSKRKSIGILLFRWIMMLISGSLMAYCAFLAYPKLKDYYDGRQTYKQIEKTSEDIRAREYGRDGQDAPVAPKDYVFEDKTKNQVETDFPFHVEANSAWVRELQQINPDIIGWITIPGTIVSYPILHGRSNNDYIHTTYDLHYNFAGSIFIESQNNPDLTDARVVIYGHNMLNGTMFSDIMYYESYDFWKQYPYVIIDTPTNRLIYKIFSTEVIPSYDTSYAVTWKYDEYFETFVKALKERSDYETDVPVDGRHQVITLSTCVAANGPDRRVVHAVEVQYQDGIITEEETETQTETTGDVPSAEANAGGGS